MSQHDTVCFYHGDCPDGFSAAWCVRRALGCDIEFIPSQYQNDTLPDLSGKRVILVDFSFKKEVLLSVSKVAKSVLIIDHHKSAENNLKSFVDVKKSLIDIRDDWFRFNETEGHEGSNVFCVFDMSACGARLTWDFFDSTPAPAFIDYVEDRDLWRNQLPESERINKWIMSFPHEFSNIDHVCAKLSNESLRSEVLLEADAINRSFQNFMESTLRATVREMVIGGYKVPVANVPHFMASDAASVLGKGQPFAATYFDQEVGRKFSLRVRDGDVDVQKIAQKFGGGGHVKASGFLAPIGWEGEEG